MAKDETYFDVRTYKKHIAAADITEAEYEEWLASLEDCTAGSDNSGVRMVATTTIQTTSDDLEEER
jgi:hypothetical protein